MSQNKGRKSTVLLFGFVTFALIVLLGGFTWHWVSSKPVSLQSVEESADSVQVDVVLKKSYICGVDEEEKLKKTVSSIDKLYQEYHDWELVSHQEDTFVFKTKVQDLAPVCKEKGYFGLSNGSLLTLFEGPPEENKVIQTFYQIDTKKIESSLPQELGYLNKGIRIKDLAEYNSILSTYEEYAEWTNNSQHTSHSQE